MQNYWRDFGFAMIGATLCFLLLVGTVLSARFSTVQGAIQSGVLVWDGKAYSVDEMGGRE